MSNRIYSIAGYTAAVVLGVAGFLAVFAGPDCYKRYKVTNNLSPNSIFVTSDDHTAHMSNVDIGGESGLESVLFLRTELGSERVLIERGSNGKHRFIPFHYEDNKLVRDN